MDRPTLVKVIYRVLSWTSIVGLVVTLALVLRKSPSPNVPYDPEAASRVQQKFEAADQAKASGQPAQVELDRTELNSYLAQNLDIGSTPPGGSTAPASAPPTDGTQSPSPDASPISALTGADGASPQEVQSSVRDVQVDMDGDIVKAHVIFNYHGKDLSLELDGHLGAQDGYLKFEPVGGKLGSLPLPQSVLDAAVREMMSSPENREKLKLPDDINDIKIQNGQAVVSYK